MLDFLLTLVATFGLCAVPAPAAKNSTAVVAVMRIE